MTVKSRIQALIQIFNPEWYDKIQTEFERHSLYNKETRKLEDSIWEDDLYDEYGVLVAERQEVEIKCDIYEYCWRGMNDPERGQDYYEKLLPKGNYIAIEIIQFIEHLLNKDQGVINPSIEEKDKLIRSIVGNMSDEIERLKKQHDVLQYHEVLDRILKCIRRELSAKYRSILLSIEAISNHKDQLRFNLNQQQLAVLLSILHKAGFIEDEGKNNNHKHFYQEHFSFKNKNKKGNFTIAKDIGGKISDAANPKEAGYNKARITIKQKLMAACESVI